MTVQEVREERDRERMIAFVKLHYSSVLGNDIGLLDSSEGREILHQKYYMKGSGKLVSISEHEFILNLIRDQVVADTLDIVWTDDEAEMIFKHLDVCSDCREVYAEFVEKPFEESPWFKLFTEGLRERGEELSKKFPELRKKTQ